MAKDFFRATALAAVVVATIVLAGCQGTEVIITYEPLVNTTQILAPPHSGSDLRFAVYCISKIDNIASGAKDFEFEIGNLRIADAKPSDHIFLDQTQNWPWSAQDTTVPGGTTEHDIGMIVLRIDVQGQPNQGNSHWVELEYVDEHDEPVSMVPYPIPPTPQFVEKLVPDNLPACTDGETIP